MSNVLDEIRAEVQEARTVRQSAIALLQGLKARLDAAIGNEAALRQLSADLDADNKAMADAIVANTPAEDEPSGDEGNGEDTNNNGGANAGNA